MDTDQSRKISVKICVHLWTYCDSPESSNESEILLKSIKTARPTIAGSSTFNRGEQQKLGFLPHLLNAALKLGSKPIEMGHLNREKPSFLVGHDLVRCYPFAITPSLCYNSE
jgi:hypothetical protein